MLEAASFDGVSEVALVGFGRIAEILYGPSLAGAPSVSICEQRDEQQTKILATIPQARIVKVAGNLTAPLDGTGIAFNLLPGPDHGPYSKYLLELGWNVFTEKPAAASLSEWRELVSTAQNCGRVIAAAPVTPYMDEVNLYRERAAREHIGALVEIRGTYFGGGPARRGYIDESRCWFFGSQSCVIRDLAPYVITPMIAMLGTPSSFIWFRSGVRSAIEVRPTGSVLPTFAPAATGVGMWGEVLGSVSLGYRPWVQNVEARLTLFGSHGEIQIDLEESFDEGNRPNTKVRLALDVTRNCILDRDYWMRHISLVEQSLTMVMSAPGLAGGGIGR